jgi:hypothetical protein
MADTPPAQSQQPTSNSYSSPAYTGGTASGQITATPFSDPYGPVTGGYGASIKSRAGTAAQCTGAIGTTFTWTGPNPAPQSTIIVETNSVSCGATSTGYQTNGAPTASCADAFGDPPTITTSYPPGPGQKESIGGTDGGTRYSVQGGQTITLSHSPNASAEAPDYEGSSAYVAYSAAVYPVTISLSGATQINGADEALTGQTISATLNLDGAPLKSGAPIVYKWSASGGNPFETWSNTTPATATAPANPNASYYVPLSAGDADATGATFTYDDATSGDQVSVNCTATVTFPDGTTGTVTAKSQIVTFVKPTAIWAVDGPGNAPVGLQTTASQYPGTSLAAYSMGDYEWWSPTSITLPSAFSGDGHSVARHSARCRRTPRREQGRSPRSLRPGVTLSTP